MSLTIEDPLLSPEALAATGLAVVSPDWNVLGLGLDKNDVHTAETGDLNVLAHRITAIHPPGSTRL